MKNPKVDRRIRKTRDTLKRTLAELVREKDLRDITVRDITEKADLNRGTFYLHYKDVYDLMEKMEDDLISEIQEMIDTSRPKPAPGKSSSKPVFETLLPMLDPIADYILDNRRNEIRAWADTGYAMLKRQSAQDPRKWVSLEPARAGAAIAGTASK